MIWIEPLPDVFEQLKARIAGYPKQRAFRCLVTDEDDREYVFHVANNNGASSSILELKHHKDIWPSISYTGEVTLPGITLSTLFAREGIDASRYQALVLDTQGSELLVLKGAVSLLGGFQFIKTEVPDFESYEGCCKLEEVEDFLKARGFREFSRRAFAKREAGGRYYDVVFRNVLCAGPRRELAAGRGLGGAVG